LRAKIVILPQRLEGKEKRIKNYEKWAVKPLQKKENGKVALRCRNERKFQAKQKKQT
jgi:hypothetical protein